MCFVFSFHRFSDHNHSKEVSHQQEPSKELKEINSLCKKIRKRQKAEVKKTIINLI